MPACPSGARERASERAGFLVVVEGSPPSFLSASSKPHEVLILAPVSVSQSSHGKRNPINLLELLQESGTMTDATGRCLFPRETRHTCHRQNGQKREVTFLKIVYFFPQAFRLFLDCFVIQALVKSLSKMEKMVGGTGTSLHGGEINDGLCHHVTLRRIQFMPSRFSIRDPTHTPAKAMP